MRFSSFISFSFILFISSISFTSFAAQTLIKASDLPTYSKIYNEKSNPFTDATNAIALANKTGRNVLIEIGGNWCTWCKKMDAFLEKNPKVYQALHSKYVLLKVSVSDENENKAFMAGLPPVLGYPHMYVSTGEGKMLLSKDTGELQENGQYNAPIWLTFLTKWQAKSASKNTTLAATK